MITCKLETIDREAAERYLNQDKGNNRPFARSHLTDLTGRQKRGEWVTNGDTIRFDSRGQLRDGQHRLRMVKETGIPIEVIVVRGIDPKAFSTMDVGKKRSFGDVLSIEHQKHAMELAPAMSFVWRYLSRHMTGPLGSYEEMQKLLDVHPQMHDSVEFYLKLSRPASAPGWPAASMAAHYLFSRVDEIKANDFFMRYVTGLHADDATDPIHVVREQVVSFARMANRPSGMQVFIMLVKAWNAWEAGQPFKKKLTIPKVTLSHKVPKIAGFPKELFIERQLDLTGNQEEDEAED